MDCIASLVPHVNKLHNAIKSNQDCNHLQEALSYTDNWCKQSNIDFNISTCKVLTISHQKSPIESKYHQSSKELLHVDNEVDLGVTATSALSWNQHINIKCWEYYGEPAHC